VARGGSQVIADAMAAYLRSLGGEIITGRKIASFEELPPARAVLFDTSPHQLIGIAGERLPRGYRRALARYHYGPAAFKLDWALDGANSLEGGGVRAGGNGASRRDVGGDRGGRGGGVAR
jgi:phytoene dehydrogenase-like protein